MTPGAQALRQAADGKTSLPVSEHLFSMVLAPLPPGPAQVPVRMPHSFVKAPSRILRPSTHLAACESTNGLLEMNPAWLVSWKNSQPSGEVTDFKNVTIRRRAMVRKRCKQSALGTEQKDPLTH